MWKLELSIVVFLRMVKLTGEGDCVSVATSTLVLPFAKVSIVPKSGSADPIGIEENTLRTISSTRIAEREALVRVCGRTGAIGPADNIRGLCRLRRDDWKKFDNKCAFFPPESLKSWTIPRIDFEFHKVTIVTIKITPRLVGIGQVAAW